jgi:hypothetical protein
MWILFIILWLLVIFSILRFFAVCRPRRVEIPKQTREELIWEVMNQLNALDVKLWDFLMENTDEFFDEEEDVDLVRSILLHALMEMEAHFKKTIGLSKPPIVPSK